MKRSAFTLVELLVSIAIIGVLLGLMLVAIQRVRESSRQMQCSHRLKELGVAMQNFHDARRHFPAAMRWHPAGEPLAEDIRRAAPGLVDSITLGLTEDEDEDYEDRAGSNWAIALLPFLEEEALFQLYDDKKPIHEFEQIYSVDIPVFKCPSDFYNEEGNHFQRSFVDRNKGYARGNYAMNIGTNEVCFIGLDEDCEDGYTVNSFDFTKTSKLWGSGIGGLNKTFRFGDFPNGTTKVVAFNEIRAGAHEWDRRGVWALGFVGSSTTASHRSGPNKGIDEICGCDKIPTIKFPCSGKKASQKANSRSLHPGGVFVAMLDGSVQFIEDSIDKDIWIKMHRRDSNEVLDF